MSAETIVHEDPGDAESRLAELGLSLPVLRDAIMASEVARGSCSSLSPRWYPGSAASANATVALREQLLPAGWIMNEDGGYSRTISPAGIAVVVATGDDATGLAARQCRTKYRKGPATIEAIYRNLLQLELFPTVEVKEANLPRPGVDRVQTWMLLIGRTEGVVRGELSLPAGASDDGRVSVWLERIMLPEISLDGPTEPLRAPEPGPDFDFPITRRVG